MSDQQTKTEELRLKGNQLFAKGEFSEALKVYAEALECDPTDFTIISNQSACYFELGSYSNAIEASNRVRVMIAAQGGQDPKQLDKKNLMRIVKALFTINDRDNLITLLNDHSADLKGSSPEMDKIYTSIEQENKRLAADATTPPIRVNDLPRFLPLRCYRGEYFVMGHDQPISALGYKIEPIKKDQYSPKDGELTRFEQAHTISLAEHPQLSFFFGGCNDGRHAIITYADLNRQVSTMPANTKMHFTLNDIKASSLARNLIFTHLLYSLGANDSIDAIYKDKQVALEASLLYFMYFSVAIPRAIYQRLIQIIDHLLSFTSHDQLPEHIIVDKAAWTLIRTSLNYWRGNLGVTTKTMRENTSTGASKELLDEITASSSESSKKVLGAKDAQKQALLEQMKNFDFMKSMIPNLTREEFDANLSKMTEMFEENSDSLVKSSSLPSFAAALQWNRVFKTMPVPEPLLMCDGTEFEGKLFELFCEISNKTKSRDTSPPKAIVSSKEFDLKWVPNVTMLDPDYQHFSQLTFDPIDSLPFFVSMKWLGEPEMEEPVFFDYFMNVAFQAARGLRQCTDRKYLTVEFDVGDLNKSLERIRKDVDKGRQAKNLPTKFDRIFLTNVPDYTGQLTVLVDTINSLKFESHSFIMFNVILNTGLFHDYEEAVHSHTLLPSIAHAQKYLGVRCLEDQLWGDNTWTHVAKKSDDLPMPLDSLAKRDEIWLWLVRVFINIMLPAKINPADVVTFNCPNNMSIFFRILDRLRDVGYPLHWLTSFIDQLLSGSVKSAAALSDKRAIKVGTAVSSTPKTINTMAFQVELRTIASLWVGQSLNARIITPLPNPSDIHQWIIGSFKMLDNVMGRPITIQDRPLYSAVIICGLCPKQYVMQPLMLSTRGIDEGIRKVVLDTITSDSILQFITMIDWNDDEECLSFWMSQTDMDRLIHQKSTIMIYRNDVYRAVTNTLSLNQAKKVVM
ncbi:hypothetical protein SAMD00019534_080760 [Acytostelium subglobosum LB1]|uniref:hypothetical protein n=1 Tax=Acytostelium subglobosum LB1 TaxID=1410327 RepID=UPI000644BA77|nr:hypothetical protein SAMD00019534_080760 [Acytostelium subglobosum LB1]GAM24901.1 hypothetical protein SAMD00019534_080760 [Acytostelium subglobosum LB1]|eukprot:XP_012751990.1 hypothetical protein SAMD00019534_080760 [Acytostelium subglobosum LB1]